MLVSVAACGTASPKPEVKAVDSTVAFPSVIGMNGEEAQKAIKDVFPRGSVMTEVNRDAYDYGVTNRCSWTGPEGKISLEVYWPVSSVVLILHPEMTAGTSATRPVQAGTKYQKGDRLFFQLHTEKPSDVWCKPYGDDGPAGGVPHVGVPNHHDHGEPWFCRHHRWC